MVYISIYYTIYCMYHCSHTYSLCCPFINLSNFLLLAFIFLASFLQEHHFHFALPTYTYSVASSLPTPLPLLLHINCHFGVTFFMPANLLSFCYVRNHLGPWHLLWLLDFHFPPSFFQSPFCATAPPAYLRACIIYRSKFNLCRFFDNV